MGKERCRSGGEESSLEPRQNMTLILQDMLKKLRKKLKKVKR